MSRYKYTLKDYHAIKDAQIILDGITVLSGINGCGKSTLSRWLYYVVNGAVDYEKNLIKNYMSDLIRLLDRMHFAFRDINRFYYTANMSDDISITSKIRNILNQLSDLDCNSSDSIKIAHELFLQIIYSVGNFLINEKFDDLPKPRIERIFTFLNINFTDNNRSRAIDEFVDVHTRWLERLTNNLYTRLNERPSDVFFNHISNRYNIDEFPVSLQLDEDGVDVIDEHISNIFNLNQVIYVDTPMSVTIESPENLFWKGLRDMIMENKKNDSKEVKKILLRIKSLLNGETVLIDDDDFIEDKTLRYVSSDKKINIDLNEAATGFKTFSYLQRLLENGYLNDHSLLLIDEPEAHLHPQWIVDYARLLVLLKKHLDLKIMIASHNPDMVAAIQAIANREGVLGDTNFYVANPSKENPHQYVYKHLGHEIGEIFESFNIALDRIEAYGNVDIQ